PSEKERIMSALGHKRTCAVHSPMSALPPKATVKADSRKRSCPHSPQADICSATWSVRYGPKGNSATAIKVTSWSLQKRLTGRAGDPSPPRRFEATSSNEDHVLFCR